MKIVIEIHDEILKSIIEGEYCGIIDRRVFDAIKQGIPLIKETKMIERCEENE